MQDLIVLNYSPETGRLTVVNLPGARPALKLLDWDISQFPMTVSRSLIWILNTISYGPISVTKVP